MPRLRADPMTDGKTVPSRGVHSVHVAEMIRTLEEAEARALAAHEAGRCSEEQWLCSHCEAETAREQRQTGGR